MSGQPHFLAVILPGKRVAAAVVVVVVVVTVIIVAASDKQNCRNVDIIKRAGGNGLSRCLLYIEVARGKKWQSLQCMNEYSSHPSLFPLLFPHGSPL